MPDDDERKKAVKQKIAGIFDTMLDRYEEHMHERIMNSWCMVGPEEKKHRLWTIMALSVELQKIKDVSIQATRLGETVIEDVILGDWKNAERGVTGICEDCGADPALWEGFIVLVKTAAAEARRLVAGVRPEGN